MKELKQINLLCSGLHNSWRELGELRSNIIVKHILNKTPLYSQLTLHTFTYIQDAALSRHAK